MTSILVTGANKGIGFHLIQTLATHPNHPDVIIAGCRSPRRAYELTALSQIYPFVKILKLDLEKVQNFPDIASQVSALVGENGLNILINNAGVPRRTLNVNDIAHNDYDEIFKTNLRGPVLLTKALLSLLKKAASLKPDTAQGFNEVAVLNVSSLLGSVSVTPNRTVWGFNESKLVLNQFTRSLSANVKKDGILVINIHPGSVKTDMGESQTPLTIGDCVAGIMKIVTNISSETTYEYLNHDGTEAPW